MLLIFIFSVIAMKKTGSAVYALQRRFFLRACRNRIRAQRDYNNEQFNKRACYAGMPFFIGLLLDFRGRNKALDRTQVLDYNGRFNSVVCV
jgi:hypothetical protein